MFERLKIEIWGHQPTAKITSRTLDKIIQRDYDDNYKEVKRKLELIKSDSLNGRNRLSAAVLKLANRNLMKIDTYIEMANTDFRDVVSKAEYPRYTEHDFGEIPADKLKEIYLADWTEYSDWLMRD
jgi:hypothetical protein